MTTHQVLIIVGLAIVVVLLIVLIVAMRRRKGREFGALTPQERELHFAKRKHDQTMSELKSELKAQGKASKKRTKQAQDRLKDALRLGADRLDSLKGRDGTVSLTGLVITTPTGDHDITPQVAARADAGGAPPAAQGEPDTRHTTLIIEGGGLSETHVFDADDEAAVRGLAAKITSAAAHVEVLAQQRDDAVRAAENEVAEANANATIEANNAQARYDAAAQASLAKVRAAEDAVRNRGINPK